MGNDVRYKIRGDTSVLWEAKNPLLLKNEIAYDQTAGRLKMGDGKTLWNDLPYVKPDVIASLESESEDAALSASQGKILNETKLDTERITHENWTFTLENDNTITKEVAIWKYQ